MFWFKRMVPQNGIAFLKHIKSQPGYFCLYNLCKKSHKMKSFPGRFTTREPHKEPEHITHCPIAQQQQPKRFCSVQGRV